MTLWRSSLSLDSVKDILTILQSIRTTSFVPEDRNEVANANATIRGRQANTGDGVVYVFDLISHGGLIQISRFDHDGPLSPLEQKFSAPSARADMSYFLSPSPDLSERKERSRTTSRSEIFLALCTSVTW